MPVDRFSQLTFASGEFDPLLASREDVAFYYSSAFLLENVVPLPQGGAKRREGLVGRAPQRGLLAEIDDMSGYTITAPNGGTAADILDPDEADALVTTTAIGTTAEYVIAQWDAGVAVRVSALDVRAILSGGAQSQATLAIQSSADSVTYTTAASITIGTTYHQRRIAVAPNSDLGTARYWRLAIITGGTDYGADVVNAYELRTWQEDGKDRPNAVPGSRKLRKITAETDAEYFALVTAGNVDLFSDAGAYLASVPIPHTDAAVAEITTSQNLDALVLYQDDFPPHIVQRLDGDDRIWRAAEFEFESVTAFPFEDAATGGQNEVQEFRFQGNTDGTSRLFLEYNGETSNEFVFSSDGATMAARLTTALLELPDISDVSVTIVTAGSDYDVEFQGVDGNKPFATVVIDILSGSGTGVSTRKTRGRPHQEDLWSPTRGYPRCGTFYQGGHWMGGFRSRPDVIVRSRSGSFGDFREDADPVATSPLVLAPDIDEQIRVEHIYPGRNLQVFTSSAEMFIPDEPITPDNVALKVSSRRGSSSGVQPVDVQGGTFFVDRNGTNLREYLFQETEQSYTAEPLSTLGGHLVQQPVDMALRRSVNTDEPTILYVVNSGRDRNFEKVPAASITVDRAQQVTAFARMVSGGGQFLATAATQGGEVAFVVERELDGNPWAYFETMDAAHMSDHSEEVANPNCDAFTATAGQTVFAYTFSSPSAAEDVGVFQRADAGDVWRRIEAADYTLDLGGQTVTLDTGLDAGTLVSICKRATAFQIAQAELNGIACEVHCDGRPVGEHTPAAGSVTLDGNEGFFFHARIGLRMVPRVVLQAYKGQGDRSPTMQRQRIFRALVNFERTLKAAIGTFGRAVRPIPFRERDSAIYDEDLEEAIFTGTKRISGMGAWELEPRLEITQLEPGPWLLRSVSYDIRF